MSPGPGASLPCMEWHGQTKSRTGSVTYKSPGRASCLNLRVVLMLLLFSCYITLYQVDPMVVSKVLLTDFSANSILLQPWPKKCMYGDILFRTIPTHISFLRKKIPN